jgi:2-dehydro-3-deoxyphosphogluconate aldolase / (4S)-4-hydroxy-2-oxoglutarate aldolase
MTKKQVCDRITDLGIIPALRVASADDARFAAEAVNHGGIPIVEITLTIPGAIELIADLVQQTTGMVIGAGTILDIDTARRCLDAGAHFLTSPGLDLEVVEFAKKKNVAILPGALTPTEVIAAWKAGSDFVKVFPCSQVGGDRYIRVLKTPLPQIPLVAAGGVNQQTAVNFIIAGATAIGVGGELIPAEAIERRQAKRIHELAGRFLGFVREGRERLAEMSSLV